MGAWIETRKYGAVVRRLGNCNLCICCEIVKEKRCCIMVCKNFLLSLQNILNFIFIGYEESICISRTGSSVYRYG